MNEFFRRIRYLMNRRRLDAELASEMDAHREMAGGGGPFGNTLRLREEARDAWGWTWIDRLAQDLRYAIRMLRKAPGFTFAAVLMLAIGLGVNVAAFSFFDLAVLRPLHVRDAKTLLRFHRRSPRDYAFALPYPEMVFFRDHSRTLSTVLAMNITPLSIEGEGKQINAHFVTPNFFSDLGATAALGRLFDSEQDGPVVVLGHGFWQRHFGSDPLIVGKTIRLNGKPGTVIGVAAKDFAGLSVESPDLWSPISRNPYFAAGSHLLTDYSPNSSGVRMWGRLRPGLAPLAAERELASFAAQLHALHPADIWEKETIPGAPGGYVENAMVGNRRGSGSEDPNELYPVLALIATLTLLILAVACGNLGSLLLARGVAREREMSIRVALGAGRGRLIRQLFTESLLLAFLGSLAGLGSGYLVLRALLALTGSPAWLSAAPDWRVVLFSIGAGFAAAILFGLAPALQMTRKRGRANIMRHLLIGAQVAASCVLLIVAGLLVRALNHAARVNPGFEYKQVISIDPRLSAHGYAAPQAGAYLEALRNRVGALPGVESVSLAWAPPLGNTKIVVGLGFAGRQINIHLNRVDPNFFQTMAIPLLRGRNLTRGDTHSVIVSESLARKAWPGEDPLGKTIDIEGSTVVGVAGSARLVAMEDSDAVEAYLPTSLSEMPSMVLLAKTATPEGTARSAVLIARAIDPQIFPQVDLLKASFEHKLMAVKDGALVVATIGFVAQLLACLGIVGVVAYAVSQRTKEIGLRMALGARPRNVLSVVMRQFFTPVLAGLLVGVGGAAALSHVLRKVLYGVDNLDPTAYLGAVGLFLITVILAMVLPARRALRVDPMLALRQD